MLNNTEQVVGLIDDNPTVKELMDRIIKEAVDTINVRIGGMMNKSARL
jgi:hypothetical protein